MSNRLDYPASALDARSSVRSLHLWRERPEPPRERARPELPTKPDRLLVGVVAGAALFYLIGRALGLGRRREPHADA